MSEDGTLRRACAEIDRLRAVNAELVEALQGMVRYAESVRTMVSMGKNQTLRFEAAKALIIKAKGA